MDRDAVDRFERVLLSLPSLSFSLSRSRGGERRRGGRRAGRRTERASAFRRYARDETGNERPDDETAESERVCRADRR